MTDNVIYHKNVPHTGLRHFQPHDAKLLTLLWLSKLISHSATAPQLMQVGDEDDKGNGSRIAVQGLYQF